MKTVMLGNSPFSQMSLGTVQLGMNYGIANRDGKPDLAKSLEILRTATEGGVTALDTAAAYGNSEQVIGRFLQERGGGKDLFLTTKFILNLPEDASAAQVKSEVRRSLEKSLENLGVDRINCLMLHRAGDFAKYGDALAQSLADVIREGLAVRAGVSIYHPEDLESALGYDLISMVQAPMNLMDHGLAKSRYMEIIRRRNIGLVVRSVFLQGLFFLNPAEMTDPDLLEAGSILEHIREIAREAGMSVAELAIAYIRDMPGVTGIVLGAENARQVVENLEHFSENAPRIDEATRSRIDHECPADIARIMKVLSRPK